MNIDGHTRVIVHLSYPSGHLRTPSVFNALCERQRRNAVLVPWQVQPGHLEAVWAALRRSESLAGVIVTIPHKTAVAGLCDTLEGVALPLGVANVARRMPDGRFIGRMYDGEGYLAGLKSQGHQVAGRRVLLLGAGGAANGIAYALAGAGVAHLAIANRTRDKAADLAAMVSRAFPNVPTVSADADGTGYDVIINATSLGLRETDPLPLDVETIAPGALVGEVVMQPDMTPLLLAAERRGAGIHKGVHMITGQAELLAQFLLDPLRGNQA